MEQQRSSLGDRTRELTSQAQQKAGEQVRSGIDSGKRRAAGALAGVADSLLHGSGETADGAAGYIRQAGEQVQRAADWLEHADVDELTHRTEEFARRQPAVFIGGAFVVGLLAARFIKSSRRNQSPAVGDDAWGDPHIDSMGAGLTGGTMAASGLGGASTGETGIGIGTAGGGAYTGGHADLPARGTTGGTSGLSGAGGGAAGGTGSTGAGTSGTGMTGSEPTSGWNDAGEVGRDR